MKRGEIEESTKGRKKSITQGTQVTTYLIQKLSRQSTHTHIYKPEDFFVLFILFILFSQDRYIYTHTHIHIISYPTNPATLPSK